MVTPSLTRDQNVLQW